MSRKEFENAEARIASSEARIKVLEGKRDVSKPKISSSSGGTHPPHQPDEGPSLTRHVTSVGSSLLINQKSQLINGIHEHFAHGLLSNEDIASVFNILSPRPLPYYHDSIEELIELIQGIKNPNTVKAIAEQLQIHLIEPSPVRSEQPILRGDFPWPPPRPSAQANIPLPLLTQPVTLQVVCTTIGDALTKLGYSYSVYPLPTGFVIATDLEPFSITGKRDGDKSHQKPRSASTLLVSYFKALFLADPGRYRVFCISVSLPITPNPLSSFSSQNAKSLAVSGGATLPSEIRDNLVTEGCQCTAFIYEFKKNSTSDAGCFIENGETATFHLETSGIFAALVVHP